MEMISDRQTVKPATQEEEINVVHIREIVDSFRY
jgi:hypothetical protein